ncbi:MAG: GAF domain-containing protein, partial [Leptospiraceae bacterium]|nr:GAF domain-containing protein [Leptospiraceae bacterium]
MSAGLSLEKYFSFQESSEKVPTMTVSELERLQQENEKLLETLEVNRVVSSSLNLEVVLGTLMEKAKVLLEAEASSLMLVDDEAQELYFHTVRGEKSDAVRKIRLKMGEGIAGWVAKEGKPVLVPDCSQDPRFYKRADQLTQFVTRSMMCVPLRARKRIIGTVQVLNKTDNRQFDE